MMHESCPVCTDDRRKTPPKTKRAGNRVARGRGARSFFPPFCEVSKSAVDVKHMERIVKKNLLNLFEKGKSLGYFN